MLDIKVRPWLPVANDYQTFNVAAEQHDPCSFLMLTRALLDVRRSHCALTLGSYQSVKQESATCFVYLRQYSDQRCLVALNFSARPGCDAAGTGSRSCPALHALRL